MGTASTGTWAHCIVPGRGRLLVMVNMCHVNWKHSHTEKQNLRFKGKEGANPCDQTKLKLFYSVTQLSTRKLRHRPSPEAEC